MDRWTIEDAPRQDGNVVLVTGGASGIGFQAARAMGAKGARVVIAARDPNKGELAATKLREAAPGGDFTFVVLDLANVRSIGDFARHFIAKTERLDVLMNVAGVMALPKRTLTTDGFEMHMGTNHLGHFALTGALLPALRRARGRVVVVSALVAKFAKLDVADLQSERDYAPMRAYGRSKLANVLFAVELNRRVATTGVASVPVDPGTANTGLQRHTGTGGGLGSALIDLIGYPLDRVADNLVFAATVATPGDETYIGPSRIIQRWAQPAYIALPKPARDAALRDALWRRSEELTGTTFDLG